MLASVRTVVRREERARLYYDAGPNGMLVEAQATRAIAAKLTAGFIYTLNSNATLRAGQVTSLKNSHYLLIDSDEVFEGLATSQFNNLLEMANGHLRRIGAEVVRQSMNPGTTPSTTSATAPSGVSPTAALPQVGS
jgi:hypothetical protein